MLCVSTMDKERVIILCTMSDNVVMDDIRVEACQRETDDLTVFSTHNIPCCFCSKTGCPLALQETDCLVSVPACFNFSEQSTAEEVHYHHYRHCSSRHYCYNYWGDCIQKLIESFLA